MQFNWFSKQGVLGSRLHRWFWPVALAGLALATSLTISGMPGVTTAQTGPRPRVILISLDSLNPTQVDRYLSRGVLRNDRGIGLLKSRGIAADQNYTVTPSLTAPSHIAIGTGSTAARNDINANSFHLVASPFTFNISGFGAPIGGYSYQPNGVPAASSQPTAEPLWIALRRAGKKVVAATFPGADGVDVRVPGLTNSPIVDPASRRTVDFTIPFGAFGGLSARGFSLTASSFGPASAPLTSQLQAAGRSSFSPVLVTTAALETIPATGPGSLTGGSAAGYDLRAAALDTTNDGQTNYDTLVFFDQNQGIQPGPVSLPSTGPAYVKASDRRSSSFYFEGSNNRVGTAFYITTLASDLSTVRFIRYAANYIPSNPLVQADVNAINSSVGFWAPQPDFRIAQRVGVGFNAFSDVELEDAYENLVDTFVDYQTDVLLEAIRRNPNADLVLGYIEQPDGSGHQFTLTDRRQATDPTNPNSIGAGQDAAKVARYRSYVERAYQVADQAVQRIIAAVGTDASGRPNSNIIIVSDHGMSPFHTAVNLNAYLAQQGFDNTKVRAVTSGPAVNLYINLQGREPNGTVTPAEYTVLQQQVATALRNLRDPNRNYAKGDGTQVFDQVVTRPTPGNQPLGFATGGLIGQDTGDVFAVMTTGYNFDGTQNPVVRRLGDPQSGPTPVFSVPSFYGAHGYDPKLPEMSAVFYAAGPDVARTQIRGIRNIDVAPTIVRLLGAQPAATVQGRAIDLKNPRKELGGNDLKDL